MSRAKLKPCPFCGCSAWLYEHKHIFLDPKSIANGQCTGYRVECEGMCHAMTCYWHTKKEAVEKWNTRTPAGQGKEVKKMTRRNQILRVMKRNFLMSPTEIGLEIGFPYNLSSAKVCNVLNSFLKKNWVSKEKLRGRSVYRITEEGKHYINSIDQEL